MKQAEIITARPQETALARIDPQALILKAIDTGAGIETMERLVALAKDVREVQAREAWYEAMAEFQRTCPAIRKTSNAKITMRSGGSYAYKYAPLDEIMTTILPVMGPLGLSVSWRSKVEAEKVIVTCRVSHTLGHHEESGDIAMPIVAGDGGANPAQRVGIAATYAKRYALLGIIGMAPEDDPDAKSSDKPAEDEGPRHQQQEPSGADVTITEPQQKRLWAIAREHRWSDEQVKDLLTSFGRDKTEQINRNEYERFIERLKQGPQRAA